MPALGQYAPGTHFRACETCSELFRVRPSDVRKAQARGAEAPRFCSIQCVGAAQRGERNPKWGGGTYGATNGYVYEHAPEHPHATQDGYVMQHRLVVERAIGRVLTPAEEVHHRNHVRDDNRIENLELMASTSAHRIHHGEWQTHPCGECGEPVRSTIGLRRRGRGKYCSRRCAAAVGSRASLAARYA